MNDAAKVEQSTPATEQVLPLKRRSYWGEVWHRLKKNKLSMACLVILCVMLLAIILSTFVSPYDYTVVDLTQRFQLPSLAHPLGTDDYGRDLLTRLLVGGRISLLIAILSVAFGLFFGLIFGAVCGYFGKYVDAVIMRIMDVIMSIPGMMLAICVSVALGSGVVNTAIALAVGTIPIITRQLRSSTMLINGQEYVEAAKTFGESSFKIILTHVIPNAMAPIIVQTSLYIGGAIMGIAGLSFLGLGVQPPTPEWGNILNNGLDQIYDFATRWNVIVFPALFIVIAELCFNLLGDGLRDAMDPRMRK
jgi:peptide/nickel transport system permease protein